MPYASNKQAAFMHIHHPDIAAKWHEAGHGYVKGGKNDPGKKKKGKLRPQVSKSKKDWAIGLTTAAAGGALANQVPPIRPKRKKRGKVEKMQVPVSTDPYFNQVAAQKVFDLVMKMDDDTAEMFTLAVMGEIYENDIEKNLGTLQRHLNEVVAKRLEQTKRAMLRAVAKGHQDGAVEAATALAQIEGLINKADEVTKADDDLPNWAFERKIRRDPGSGRFTVKVKHTQTKPFSNRVATGLGLTPTEPAQRLKYAKLTNKQKAQYQDEYRQLAQFLNVVTQSGEGGNQGVHLRLQDRHGNEFRQPHVGGADVANEVLLNPNLTLLGVEAAPTTLNVGGSVFGLANALGYGTTRPGAVPGAGIERAVEHLPTFRQSWTAPGDNKVTNARLYNRVGAAGAYVSEVAPKGSKPYMAAKLAEVVGSHGPEAEAVIGPTARKTAYRYRGVEKTPDRHIVWLYGRAIAHAKGQGLEEEPAELTTTPGGRKDIETANRKPTGAKERRVPGEEPAIGQMGPRRAAAEDRPPNRAELADGRRIIQDQLKANLPAGSLYELQSQSGNLPPSEGILLNSKGQIVTQASGYGDDHYLPFNLKNLKSLKGGEYIRTRSVGGLTSEDIYTGLYAGARRVTVVSRSGTFSVEFEPDFRGGRRYNDKAVRMTRRYEQLLDAVQSNKVSQGPVPEPVKQAIQHEVAVEYPGESRLALRSIVNQRIQEYREDPEMSEEDEKLARMVYEQGMRDNPSRDEVEWLRSARDEVKRGKKFNYTLDAAGYEAAQDALAEQFPYYLKSHPLIKPDEGKQPSTERDKGYVEPGRLRPTAVMSGLFGTETNQAAGKEVGSQKFSASQANFQRGRIGEGRGDVHPVRGGAAAARGAEETPETPTTPGQPPAANRMRAQLDADDAAIDLYAAMMAPPGVNADLKDRYSDIVDLETAGFAAVANDPEKRARFSQMVAELQGELEGDDAPPALKNAYRSYRRASGLVGAVGFDERMAAHWPPSPMEFGGKGYELQDTDEDRRAAVDVIDRRTRSVTTGLPLSELAAQGDEAMHNELKALRRIRAEIQADPTLQNVDSAAKRKQLALDIFTTYDPAAVKLIAGAKDQDLIDRMTDVHRMRILNARYQGTWPYGQHAAHQAGAQPGTRPPEHNPILQATGDVGKRAAIQDRLAALQRWRQGVDDHTETDGDDALLAAQAMLDQMDQGYVPSDIETQTFLTETQGAFENAPGAEALLSVQERALRRTRPNLFSIDAQGYWRRNQSTT